MNCQNLQEGLFDYLDSTLSPAQKAEAERHLLECSTCHQVVQQERLLAQTLSDRLIQAVEPVVLDGNDQRIMARAVQRRIAKCPERTSLSFWGRFALPAAAAALIVIGAFWIGHRVASNRPEHLKAPASLAGREPAVPVDLSYSVADYTFQKQGTMVVDALTYHKCVVDGAFLARK